MTIFLSVLLILALAVLFTRLATALSVPYPSFLALVGALLALLPRALQYSSTQAWRLRFLSLRSCLWRPLKHRCGIFTIIASPSSCWRRLPWGSPPQRSPSHFMRWSETSRGRGHSPRAIVAPPDAAAATAVLRDIKIPSRVVTILEGESLFNDASALLIFALRFTWARMATPPSRRWFRAMRRASLGASFWPSALQAGPFFLQLAGDAPASIVLQFCLDFRHLDFRRCAAIVGNSDGGCLRDCPCSPHASAKCAALAQKIVCGLGNGLFLANALAFMLLGMQLAPLLQNSIKMKGRAISSPALRSWARSSSCHLWVMS